MRSYVLVTRSFNFGVMSFTNAVANFGNAVAKTGNNYERSGNDYERNGNAVERNGNEIERNGNDIAKSGNEIAKSGNTVVIKHKEIGISADFLIYGMISLFKTVWTHDVNRIFQDPSFCFFQMVTPLKVIIFSLPVESFMTILDFSNK